MPIEKLYKIQIIVQMLDEKTIKKEYKAKKIFENESFYTFEYVNEKGYTRKETIAKNDCKNNKNLIMEG